MTPVMLQLDLGVAVRTLQVPPWYDFVNKILEDWNCTLLAPCTWNSDLKIRSFRDTSNTSCRRYTLIGLRFGLNYCSTPMYWKVLLLFTSVDWENKILPIESSPFDIIAAAHLHTKDQIHPTTCNTLSIATAFSIISELEGSRIIHF